MSEAQFLGMLVIALASLIGLFIMVYKPLSDNTKAMTTLGLKMQYLTERLDFEREEHKEHIKDFEEYKEHMSEGQRRQWEVIDEHTKKIEKHETEIQVLKHKQ